jgi:ribosome-associated protein
MEEHDIEAKGPRMTTAEDLPEPRKITLDQFLKQLGWASTGGHAKLMIQAGEVEVNGAVETRRGRQLVPGDVVSLGGNTETVPTADTPPEE